MHSTMEQIAIQNGHARLKFGGMMHSNMKQIAV